MLQASRYRFSFASLTYLWQMWGRCNGQQRYQDDLHLQGQFCLLFDQVTFLSNVYTTAATLITKASRITL